MRVLFVHDGPLFYDKNGKYYEFAYHNLLERYQMLGSNVSFMMRTNKLSKDRKYTQVPNEIEVISIPNFKSISSLKNLKKAKRIIKENILNNDIIVFRLPSEICQLGIKYAKKYNKPYIIECVGCAWDSYWNHSLLGKIYAPYSYIKMKKVIMKADYVYYVTDKFLQKRYPTKGNTVSCSNVVLNNYDENILDYRKKINKKIKEGKSPIFLGTAAAIDVKYKGQQYVIKAISELNKQGYNFNYKLAGGYTSQNGNDYLKKIAKKYNVEDKIIFMGSLNKNEMDEFYNNIDFYIQPSKQEGLPRAMIEAMNHACPCIGSNIAGIPELIQEDYLFKPGNVDDIKNKIEKIYNSNLDVICKNNFDNSKKYLKAKLDKKRKDFYEEFLKNI